MVNFSAVCIEDKSIAKSPSLIPFPFWIVFVVKEPC